MHIDLFVNSLKKLIKTLTIHYLKHINRCWKQFNVKDNLTFNRFPEFHFPQLTTDQHDGDNLAFVEGNFTAVIDCLCLAISVRLLLL